jgi:hypothetical protein
MANKNSKKQACKFKNSLNMKTVIKINNLIGTLVLVTSKEDAPEKIAAEVTAALTKAIKTSEGNQE